VGVPPPKKTVDTARAGAPTLVSTLAA
jgi:hypothetical protein